MAVIEITVLIVFVIIFVWYTTETKQKEEEPLLDKECNEQLYETKKKLKDVNLRIRKLKNFQGIHTVNVSNRKN